MMRKSSSDDEMPFVRAAEIRVRYSETDKMGFVYNAHYLTWFEVGRTEFCRRLGRVYREWEEMGYMLPLSEAYCRYKSPARYDDLLTILCRTPMSEIKPHSVVFEYRIEAEDGRLIAEGSTKHAFVGADGKLIRRGNEFQQWLSSQVAELADG